MYNEEPKGNQYKLVMSCDTRTYRSVCQLNNTVNYARPIEDMMSETLGIDGEEILDDDQEVLDEGPPEGHGECLETDLQKQSTPLALFHHP
jgi:hypothetical protein